MIRVILLFLPIIACGATFKERVTRAKSGEYFVIEANKMVTLIAVRPSTPTSIIIEEISIPSQSLPKITDPNFWNEWAKRRAPGHTSWLMVEIDTTTSLPVECYSFTRGAWMQLNAQESLFSTLLQLPLSSLPLEERRKIGPPPLDGTLDTRQLWEPPIFSEGKKKTGPIDTYGATWPQDGTELSGKSLTLYFSRESPFPIWVQVEGAAGTVQVKTIDTGRNFSSPHRTFPRRVPQFIGSHKRSKNGVTMNLKSPQYYREFELYAIDLSTPKREICPVHFSHSRQDEFITIEIEEEELQNCLKKDHRYSWLFVPVGHSESYTESTKDFLWR